MVNNFNKTRENGTVENPNLKQIWKRLKSIMQDYIQLKNNAAVSKINEKNINPMFKSCVESGENKNIVII